MSRKIDYEKSNRERRQGSAVQSGPIVDTLLTERQRHLLYKLHDEEGLDHKGIVRLSKREASARISEMIRIKRERGEEKAA